MKIKSLMIALTLTATSLLLAGCYTDRAYRQGEQAFLQQDYHIAFTHLIDAAQYGDTKAQYAVGYMYYYGLGAPQSDYLARLWLYRSASMGDTKAMNAIARLQEKPEQYINTTQNSAKRFSLASPRTTILTIPTPRSTDKG